MLTHALPQIEALTEVNRRQRADLARWRPIVDAARAWRARITSDPNLWAGDEDFALIAAVDALNNDQESTDAG